MIQPKRVHYPESDGRPMAETEFHAEVLSELVFMGRSLLRAQRDRTHVAGNQLFYWVEGDPKKCFSPDVYVVRGVPQRPPRRIWKLWEEPEASLDFVIELSSASSWGRDVGYKVELYSMLGVSEYVVFDVLREGPMPQLQMWRRQHGALRQVNGTELRSEILGATLHADGWRLRLVGPDGAVVLGPEERVAAAELRSEVLDEQLEIVRARAEAASQRAETEAQRADAQAEKVRALERELARLRGEEE